LEQKALTFIKSIDKGDIPSLVLIHGQEEYLVKTILEKIREKFGGSLTVLWGEETDPEVLMSEVSEGDMFSSTARRAVFLMNFDRFLKSLGRSKKALSNFTSRLGRIRGSHLFLYYPQKLKQSDLRKEPFSAIAKVGLVVSAERLPRKKVLEMVRKKLEREAGGIEEDALELLISLTEGDLMVLKQETEKLITYADGERITLEMVAKVSAPWSRSGIFDLLDAFFEKRVGDYLRSLKDLVREGTPPIQIFAMISSYSVKLYQISSLMEKGIPQEEAMRRTGIQGGFQSIKFKSYMKNWKREELRQLVQELYRTDRRMKVLFEDPLSCLENLGLTFSPMRLS
jgi:DNA polymerase-3 subunit delta